MTREEALAEKYISRSELINKIYNDHEAQLNAKDELIKDLECRAYHAEGYISDLHNNSKEQQ